MGKNKDSNDFEIDGVVIKVNKLEFQKELGFASVQGGPLLINLKQNK